MYSVTGAPRAWGQAQDSLKEEDVMSEGVGGGGARGGAGRVVAGPAIKRDGMQGTVVCKAQMCGNG